MIVVDPNEVKKLDLRDLKQSRAQLHRLLHESDSISEREPAAAEVNKSLHAELEAVQQEILRKESGFSNGHVARAIHGNGHVSGDSRFDRELRDYSLVRAIAGAAGLEVDWGRERELSAEIQKRSG